MNPPSDEAAAKESAEKWCDANPMNRRGPDGLTSWGVYSHGFLAGCQHARSELAQEIADLKEALRFYALKSNNEWVQFNDDLPESEVFLDGGDRAREVLAKYSEK